MSKNEMTFEQALCALEETVNALESGEKTLQESMELYEKAEQLTSNGLLLLDIKKKKEAYSNENL